MTVYTRADWHARPAGAGPGPLAARNVIGLVFHWPAMTKPVRGVKAVAAALRAWQDYHMDDRGWSDIAYQEAYDQDGNVWILRGLDTQSAANGNEDVNDDYGAVLLILAPGEEPTAAMLTTVRKRVAEHRRLFPNSHQLLGHNQVRPEPTQCPGPIVQALIDAGELEPVPTPRELLREDLRPAIAAAKKVLARAGSRPRVRFHAQKALEHLRRARDINQGD